MPRCKRALFKIGVYPIIDHYYEPQFDIRESKRLFSQERPLPGIDWNIDEQLRLLGDLTFSNEVADMPTKQSAERRFYLNNGSFESGDAEFWYQIIRLKKPKRIFEIGSGNSTLMALQAIQMNRAEDPHYACEHVCIEPYEASWLEQTSASIIRSKVEDLDVAFFSALEENDILFIDSSHIIRPQGDVVYEFLELLPTLRKGVIVHIHDIFSPRNYLKRWLMDEVKFWNEQYLLEAFLSHNSGWKVIASLNYLHHRYFDELRAVAPFLTREREPGSFYLQRVA